VVRASNIASKDRRKASASSKKAPLTNGKRLLKRRQRCPMPLGRGCKATEPVAYALNDDFFE
jgi:hypothetical protein